MLHVVQKPTQDRSFLNYQAARGQPAGVQNRQPSVLCFNIKHNVLWSVLHTPSPWHFDITVMISSSQICCNNPTLYIAAIFVKYHYTNGSWLFCIQDDIRYSAPHRQGKIIVKQNYWFHESHHIQNSSCEDKVCHSLHSVMGGLLWYSRRRLDMGVLSALLALCDEKPSMPSQRNINIKLLNNLVWVFLRPITLISMALRKASVTPLLTLWSYCSLALSYRCDILVMLGLAVGPNIGVDFTSEFWTVIQIRW